MATISISVVAGAQTTTVTKTISAADLQRFITAHRARFEPIYDANGTGRMRTDAEVVQAWAEQVFSDAKGWVRSAEVLATTQATTGITLT